MGRSTLERTVATITPEITTVARGFCTSAPAIVEIAIGIKPTAAIISVVITGRRE